MKKIAFQKQITSILNSAGFKIKQYQIEIIDKIVNTFLEDKKVVFLEAPTGYGKSVIAYAVIKLLNQLTVKQAPPGISGYILVHRKHLQQQYHDTFAVLEDHKQVSCEEHDVTVIMGKDNYACRISPKTTVSKALCKMQDLTCPAVAQCNYKVTVQQAKHSAIVVGNYQLFFSLLDTQANLNLFTDAHGGGYSAIRDIAVFDEGHNFEQLVTEYRTVYANSKLFDNVAKFTDKHEKLATMQLKQNNVAALRYVDQMQKYAQSENADMLPVFEEYFTHVSTVESQLTNLITERVVEYFEKHKNLAFTEASYQKFMHDSRDVSEGLRVQDDLAKALCKWSNYKDSKATDFGKKVAWVQEYDEATKSAKLIPLFVGHLSKDLLNRIADRFLIMSATLPNPKYLSKALGIYNYEFIQADSVIPVTKRSVLMSKEIQMSWKMSDEQLQSNLQAIVSVVKSHTKQKENGIIHTVSFLLAKAVAAQLVKSKVKVNIILHTANKNLIQLIHEYKTSTQPSVLISPSLTEGVDFPEATARYQIIAKTPFLSLGSKFVREKMKQSVMWYEMRAVIQLLQAFGRIVRSEKDYGVTYVLDAHAAKLIKKYQYVISKDILKAIRIVHTHERLLK